MYNVHTGSNKCRFYALSKLQYIQIMLNIRKVRVVTVQGKLLLFFYRRNILQYLVKNNTGLQLIKLYELCTCIRGPTSTTHQGSPSSASFLKLQILQISLNKQSLFPLLPQLCTFSLSLSTLICARAIISKKCARTPTNVCPAGEPKPN